MSQIKPFAALRPDAQWLNEMLIGFGTSPRIDVKFSILKGLLEPYGEKPLDHSTMRRYLDTLDTFTKRGSYIPDDKPCIYIYERESAFGTQYGVWTLTNLNDLLYGTIITHEETLSAHEERLISYRRHVGLEGSPVLLTYQRDGIICGLIEKQVVHKPDLEVTCEGNLHRIWKVDDPQNITAFQEAFDQIKKVYVADGHHRLAAAGALNQEFPQWITSLYISSRQLQCREFHRMIIPEKPMSFKRLSKALTEKFYISAIPKNAPFRPGKAGRFGLYHQGLWYQLDLKAEHLDKQHPDVTLLQNKVLEPVFGIDDPKTDLRLTTYPADHWPDLLAELQLHPNAIAFTLYPMTADELIKQADWGNALPPKSTYVEPKIPYGLMLYKNQAQALNIKSIYTTEKLP